MSKAVRYSPEVRERAVRMVFEQKAAYDSEWAAIRSIAEQFGCKAEQDLDRHDSGNRIYRTARCLATEIRQFSDFEESFRLVVGCCRKSL